MAPSSRRRRPRVRLGDPTLADAILERLVHNAYRLQLKGDSQRKARSSLAMSITSR